MNLAREILLRIEESPGGKLFLEQIVDLNIEGWSSEEISYHVKLLTQAGLVEGFQMRGPVVVSGWMATGLTWNGHEFLDLARDNKLWKRAIAKIKSKGAGITFEILKPVLVEMVKEQVKALLKS